LGDDFENKGRLSFDCEVWKIQKLIALYKIHKNLPKITVKVKRITNPKPITEEIKKAGIERLGFLPKTLKYGAEEEVEEKIDAFHLPKFIKVLKSTDIQFIYEAKEYLDNQAVINQHKPLMFNPKRKRK
jgi:hypothetical protein